MCVTLHCVIIYYELTQHMVSHCWCPIHSRIDIHVKNGKICRPRLIRRQSCKLTLNKRLLPSKMVNDNNDGNSDIMKMLYSFHERSAFGDAYIDSHFQKVHSKRREKCKVATENCHFLFVK